MKYRLKYQGKFIFTHINLQYKRHWYSLWKTIEQFPYNQIQQAQEKLYLLEIKEYINKI